MERIRSLARRAVFSLGGAHLWYQLRDWLRPHAHKAPPKDDNGVPLPPTALINLVIGDSDVDYFLRSGEADLKILAAAVDRNGGEFKNAERVLDFGCGCGRLARHGAKLTDAVLYGVDYNRVLAAWCARSLKGDFSRNALHPPLNFPNEFFDIVYLLSIFTHLRAATQGAWLSEFRRILKPGGFALVTFHDEDHPRLRETGVSPEALIERGLVVHNDAAEGSNFIGTFQSRDFTRGQFGACFDVAEIVPSGESGLGQALAVLRCRPV